MAPSPTFTWIALSTSGCIASQEIVPAARDMWYGLCPMISFDPVKVAKIVTLLFDHVIRFMIAAGKAVKPAMPKGSQLALSEVVFEDRFV